MTNNTHSHFFKIALKCTIMFVVSERQIFHYMTYTFTVNNVLFFLTSSVGIKHSSGISE